MKDRLIRFSILSLLALLPVSAVLRAADPHYTTLFYFKSSWPLCYNYAAVPTSQNPTGTPLAKGEKIRIALVRDAREDTTTAPFTLNAMGDLLPEEKVDVVWCHLQERSESSDAPTEIAVETWKGVPGNMGITSGDDIPYTIVHASYTGVVGDGKSGTLRNYLVVLDTREEDGTPHVGSGFIARYAVRQCPEVVSNSTSSNTPTMGVAGKVVVGYWTSAGTHVDFPGLEMTTTVENGTAVFTYLGESWKTPTLAFGAFMVPQLDEKGNVVKDKNDNVIMVEVDGTTPEGKARIEAYLTPVMQSFGPATPATESSLSTTETESASAFVPFALAASSPDLNYYALETKASLADQEWRDFTDLVNTWVEEKELDTAWKKDYTRCRIDGETPLQIPVWSGETGRFYRLRMVNQ